MRRSKNETEGRVKEVTTVRLPPEIRQGLKEIADRTQRSISDLIVDFVRKGIENELEGWGIGTIVLRPFKSDRTRLPI